MVKTVKSTKLNCAPCSIKKKKKLFNPYILCVVGDRKSKRTRFRESHSAANSVVCSLQTCTESSHIYTHGKEWYIWSALTSLLRVYTYICMQYPRSPWSYIYFTFETLKNSSRYLTSEIIAWSTQNELLLKKQVS